MNTEQYRIYETIILHHIKHVQNIQEYSRLSRTSPQDFFKSQLMSEREICLAKGEEGHLRYLQELAILVITGFFILDPLFTPGNFSFLLGLWLQCLPSLYFWVTRWSSTSKTTKLSCLPWRRLAL